MPEQRFNYMLSDAQGTLVEPLDPSEFDVSRYYPVWGSKAKQFDMGRSEWNGRYLA